MSDRWHVPRHLWAYLLIRLVALALLIILISTGELVELVVLFLPFIAMGLVWTLAYRRTVSRARRSWRSDKLDN
ncbi:MAG: hypothetical protein ACREX3_00115 [Gammaproteobacteria bacterium]